jgi:Cu-processing system ATP-binding protein
MIQVEHLTKRFGAQTAVDDVSFSVRAGETFALLGPNGSGKTTTLKCLAGLSAPTRGAIRINDYDLGKQMQQARATLSYLPQRVSFPDSLTGREVLDFYRRLRRLPAGRVNEVLGDGRFDFNGFTGKSVGQYSGGMVQRLGLAVACLPDAPILLLDEPTASLDPAGAIQFREFLRALKGAGKTIVFTSHVLADVEQLADRVAMLVNGRLAALETIGALRAALLRHSRMRVYLREPAPQLCAAARAAGAREAVFEGQALLITARAEERLAILRALEAAGAQVERFATEELSLENIYLQYIEQGSDEKKQ